MNLDTFIFDFLKRRKSLFSTDLETNSRVLSENISNKSILVIGGAGTIGTSFIKAALKFYPKKVVVVDINENGLTELVRDLRSTENQFIPEEFLTYPLSFDSQAFDKLFKAYWPFEIVANFAAHKHVRSEKDIYSIEALLENNVIKAQGLLDLLTKYPPKHFFCVSTDKAANPVNIMGASKKIMEELILAYSNCFKVSTARFANVAFSNGSLLDGFLRRMEKKQPLSCPSDVKRFFVSPQEAGEICLLACILSNSAEIFFPKLDMENDLLRFTDILPDLLHEFGYKPHICSSEEEAKKSMNLLNEGKYPVYFFNTDTSGEKLYEEFYTDTENFDLSRFAALGVIGKKSTYSTDEIKDIIMELKELISDTATTKSDIVTWFSRYISEFMHIETGLGLDKKM